MAAAISSIEPALPNTAEKPYHRAHQMFIARRLSLSNWHIDRQQLGRRASQIAVSPASFFQHMSKRSGDTDQTGDRAVRAKVSEQQNVAPAAAAAAAADAAEADLDLLYGDDSVQQQQQQNGAPKAAAVAAAGGADEDLDLDDLYAECDNQQQQQQQHHHQQQQQAAALSRPQVGSAPHQAIVAAAAADGTTQQQQQQQQQTAQAASQQSQLATAAAAAAAAADGSKADPAAASSTKPAAAAAATKGSGRVPPTRVVAPDLPADLDVFSNAVLLVDKPTEWTSFDACNVIKKAIKRIGISKVGHAGTLDPAATGLLIICTGSGTKSIEGFMAAHKEYSGTLKLGEGTPSLDAETPVEETLPWEHITDEQLQEGARKLTGDIQQVPPMYSALHHNGKRLHELARAGETVERPARPVTITRFDVHRDTEDRQLVHFYVGCTKGTYIRTLGHDLATSLGSTGHLVALRREAIGDARVDKAWQIQDLQDKLWAAIRARDPEAAALSDESSGSREGRRPRGNGKGRKRGKGRSGNGSDSQQQPVAAAAAAPTAGADAALAAAPVAEA